MAPDNPFTCRGCGLLCDDLLLDAAGLPRRCQPNSAGEHEICSCAASWLNQAESVASEIDRISASNTPAETETEWQQQLTRLQQLLHKARQPLFCGLQGLTLEAESAALELARNHGAIVSLGLPTAAWKVGQTYGGASCSFGEILHRADLIISCNADVLHAWKRFEERFLLTAGRFLKHRNNRTLLYFGEMPPSPATESTTTISAITNDSPELSCESSLDSRYDERLFVPAGQFPAAVAFLRAVVQQSAPSPKQASDRLPAIATDSACGALSVETCRSLAALAERLLQAEYPVLLTPADPELEFDWAQLVQEVNLQGRIHRLIFSPGPAAGKPSEALLAQTGFPDAIQLQGEQILHDDLLFQPAQLLADRACDLIFWIGGHVSSRWADWFQQIPAECPLVILTESRSLTSVPAAALVMSVARAGVDSSGVCLRADGVPLPVHAVRAVNSPDITACLRKLLLQSTK